MISSGSYTYGKNIRSLKAIKVLSILPPSWISKMGTLKRIAIKNELFSRP